MLGSGLVKMAIIAAMSLAAIIGYAPHASGGPAHAGLFGSREHHSPNLTRFPKWRDALHRFDRELASCGPDSCKLDQWRELLSSNKGQDVMSELRLINRAINRHSYIEDSANWQQADYWATPLQFMDRSGDCEDFAIAKYMALRSLGMPGRDMRLVILHDRVRAMKHAVLAVYVDGQPYILDNLRDDVRPADAISDYVPIYSINEQGWWLHRS